MAFIKNSVGALGGNQTEDVKVIQWLLSESNKGYCFTNCVVGINMDDVRLARFKPKNVKVKFPEAPNIQSNGVMNSQTQKAIDDFSRFCLRQKFYPDGIARLQSTNSTLSPDSDLYKRLVWATVHTYSPKFIATADDYNDPRVKQAINGRISFAQFQFILEQSRWKGLTPLGKELQNHLNNPKVLAFLDLIAKAETWFDDRYEFVPYDMRVGFVRLPNLYQHPGRVSGRYQFTSDTWNTAKSKCGLYDFTPESQDIAGVYLLSTLPYGNTNKILQVILSSNIEEAIELASGTWASFPTKYDKTNNLKANFDRNSENESRYSPQHSAPLNRLLDAYDKYLSNK
jgi:muramidase (phage lysozyme)